MAADAIESDDTDWTWVLDRACGECGFRADAVPATQVRELLRGHLDRWARVLERRDVRTRARPERWSDLEYACHVRDVLTVFAERIEQMLGENPTTFADWDQDAAAIEADYATADPQVLLGQLDRAGARLAGVLALVGSDDWDRRALRSNGSVFTVASLVQYLRHDLEHHLFDVQA